MPTLLFPTRRVELDMKSGIKLLIVAIAALLIIASAGCGKRAEAWESYELTSIMASPMRVNIVVNQTSSNLSVSAIHSRNGSASGGLKVVTNNLTFKSSNENIAVVTTGGQIKGISGGTANITVSYNEGKITRMVNVPVTVTAPPET